MFKVLTRTLGICRIPFSVLAIIFLNAGIASAAEEITELFAAIDTIWVLMATALVFLMHAGFAMVETGFTRAKNAGNIIMKNFMTFCGGSISYIFVGFGIMFGLSILGFAGTGTYSLGGDWSHLGLEIPNYVFLIFQAVFAATAATRFWSGCRKNKIFFVFDLQHCAYCLNLPGSRSLDLGWGMVGRIGFR